MNKYRMYIDEVGNPNLGSSDNPNHRFLSLTGVLDASSEQAPGGADVNQGVSSIIEQLLCVIWASGQAVKSIALRESHGRRLNRKRLLTD